MVGIYIRVSSVGQAKEDKESLPEQKKQGISFADRLGLPYKIYVDTESGTKLERDDFQHLIDDIDNKNITIVWTPYLDRLARDVADGMMLTKKLKKNKIKLFVGDDERKPEDITSLLKNTMEFLFAEMEASKIKDRMLSKKIISMDKGNKRKPATYGYDGYYNEDGERRIHINPEEAVIIKSIFKDFLAGVSLRYIAIRLNEQKVPTKKGGQWRQPTIAAMLKRPEYCGYTTNYDKSKMMKSTMYDPIISKEDFDKVQDIYDNLCKGRPHGRGKKISEYELSGVIRCAKCGAYYYYKKSYKNRATKQYMLHYYTHDYNLAAGKGCTQNPKSLPKERMEKIIKLNFFMIFNNKDITKKIFDRINTKNKDIEKELNTTSARIDKKVDELTKKISNLLKYMEDGMDEVKDRMIELKAEKSKLLEEKEALKKRMDIELEETRIYNDFVISEVLKLLADKNVNVVKGLYKKYFKDVSINDSIITITLISGLKCQFDLDAETDVDINDLSFLD